MPQGNNNVLKFKLSAWSKHVESFQYKIPFDTPHDFRNVLELEYKAGNLQILEIQSKEDKPIGVVFFRVEKYKDKEFVIVALYSEKTDSDTSQIVNDFCETIAKKLGCVSIRFNTLRPALVEKGLINGYHISEITLRKKL